jgi:hypothetical protein
MQQPSAYRNDLHSHWLHAVPQALVHLQVGAGQGRRAIANQAGRLRSLSATGRPRSSKLEHRLAAHKQRCCTAVAGPHPHLSKAAASQQPIAAVWPFGNLNLCRQAAQTAKGERHAPRRLVNGGVESIAQAEAAGRQHAGLAAAPGRYQETPCSTAVAGASWQLAHLPSGRISQSLQGRAVLKKRLTPPRPGSAPWLPLPLPVLSRLAAPGLAGAPASSSAGHNGGQRGRWVGAEYPCSHQ